MRLRSVRPDDIVLIDGPATKGSDGAAQALRRYFAMVVERYPHGLVVRRLDGGASFDVRERLVLGHWSKRG